MSEHQEEPETMLCDLPNEVLIDIFAYTRPRDRMNLMSPCRRFYNLVADQETLMEEIQLAWNFRQIADVEKFIACLNESDRCYTSLKIEMDCDMKEPFFEAFTAINRFESLRYLQLRVTTIELEDLTNIVNNLPILEVLNLSGNHLKNSRGFSGKLEGKKLKKLEIRIDAYDTFPGFVVNPLLFELHVSVSDVGITNLLGQQNNLTTLDIHSLTKWDCPLNFIEEIFNKFMKMTKLRKLDLNLFKPDYNFIRNLPSSNTLEVLSIEAGCTEANKSLVQAFILKFPELREISLLNFADGHQWQGEELGFLNRIKNLEKLIVKVAQQRSVLRHLDLKKLKDISLYYQFGDTNSEELIEFLRKHPLLENFEFRVDKQMDEKIWIFIRENLKNLKKF